MVLSDKYKDRIGLIRKMNNGLYAKIIEYRKSCDIDVIFLDDGHLRKGVRYSHFLDGKIDKVKDRVGEIYKLNCGATAKIIKYKSSLDVDVEIMENNEIIKCMEYSNITKGMIRPRYYPSVYGIGYLGECSIYNENKHINYSYKKWSKMIQRCYTDINQAYKDVFVCKEWHNYSNFKKWFDDNYYEIDNEIMEIDKDILVKGNKIYSPETCLIVPHYINVLILDNKYKNSHYPTGVDKRGNKFVARISKNNKRVHIGSFETEDEAYTAYKIEKEQYIKYIADQYKSLIPQNVYDALYKYTV